MSWWLNSSADEKDKLKVMHYYILVCVVFIHMASIIDSVLLGPWITHTVKPQFMNTSDHEQFGL